MNVNIWIGADYSNNHHKLSNLICKHSILKHQPRATIKYLDKRDLETKRIYQRTKDEKASTEFTYSRFLVPYLNNYDGIAIFCDNDFMWRCDIYEIIEHFYDSSKAIMCVQHDYKQCNSNFKMNGISQEWYPRKNWSSLMIFNCAHPKCKLLNIDSVANKSGKWLHRLEWVDDDEIGAIPLTYNYLYNYNYNIENPKAIHFTDGIPGMTYFETEIKSNNLYLREWNNYKKLISKKVNIPQN